MATNKCSEKAPLLAIRFRAKVRKTITATSATHCVPSGTCRPWHTASEAHHGVVRPRGHAPPFRQCDRDTFYGTVHGRRAPTPGGGLESRRVRNRALRVRRYAPALRRIKAHDVRLSSSRTTRSPRDCWQCAPPCSWGRAERRPTAVHPARADGARHTSSASRSAPAGEPIEARATISASLSP